MPILLDGKKEGNRGGFIKKASSKAALFILLLYNFSEDPFLLFPIHPQIVLSSLCLFAAKSGVSVFGEDNARKSKRDDPENTGIDKKTRTDNLGIRTDANARTDNPSIKADNLSIAADNSSITTDNPGITADISGIEADNSGTKTNVNARADYLSTTVDNLGTATNADAVTDNSSTTISNKGRIYAMSFFALHSALFLLVFFSELVTASLPSSLPALSSTTLQLKLVLVY